MEKRKVFPSPLRIKEEEELEIKKVKTNRFLQIKCSFKYKKRTESPQLRKKNCLLNPHLICNKFKPQNPDIIPPLHIPLNTHKICKFSEMKIDGETIWGLFVLFLYFFLLVLFLFLLLFRFRKKL